MALKLTKSLPENNLPDHNIENSPRMSAIIGVKMRKMAARVWRKIIYIWHKWTFRPYVIVRRIAGEEIPFLIGDQFGQGWYGPEHEPWPELDWIKNRGITNGDIVIDCGANHGFSTVLFAKWAGASGKVVAYEPLRHNLSILERNLELNKITNVTVRHAAVGAESGSIAITTHPNATIIKGNETHQRTEMVPLISLDAESFPGAVTFMKIDVEGFELEVLRGARKILDGRPRLALELHVMMYRDKVGTLREIFSLIGFDRYTLAIQREVDGPIRPYDPVVDSIEALAKLEVVHLFCR